LTQLGGDPRTEHQTPLPHYLVGNFDAALGEQLLDLTELESEAEVQLDFVADDVIWIGVWLLADLLHARAPANEKLPCSSAETC
jgi:hypothetical protein